MPTWQERPQARLRPRSKFCNPFRMARRLICETCSMEQMERRPDIRRRRGTIPHAWQGASAVEGGLGILFRGRWLQEPLS